jgi:hypothetical protein
MVMVHWRLARSQGFRPDTHLLAFLQGFCGAVRLARRLSPDFDAVREGLDEARVAALVDQVRELLQWDHLNEQLPNVAAALIAAPKLLDQLLNLEKPDAARKPQGVGGRTTGSKTPFWAGLLKWGLFVTAILLWFQHLTSAETGWPPRGEIGVAAILLGWALLLGSRAMDAKTG